MEAESVHPLSADVFPFPGAWGADYLSLSLGRDLLWCIGFFLLLWLLDWASERLRSRRRPEAARSALAPALAFGALALLSAFGLFVLWVRLPPCQYLAQGTRLLHRVRPFARAMADWAALGGLGSLFLLVTARPVWRRRAVPPAGGAWKAWVPRLFWLLFLAALLRGLAPLPTVRRLAEISAGGACGAVPSSKSEPSNFRTFKPSNAAPFDLAAAIAAAKPGAEILVPPGVYPPIYAGGKRLVIRAVEGPGKTVIDASLLWEQGVTNRCATLVPEREVRRIEALFGRVQYAHQYLKDFLIPQMGAKEEFAAAARRWPPEAPAAAGSRLVGFTIRRGRADAGGGAFGGALEDCRVEDCHAAFAGGGAFGALLEGCSIAGCTAGMGGGVWGGRSSRCRFEADRAEYGGGARGGVHDAPVFRGNLAKAGGACAAARLSAPVFEGNRALRLESDAFGGSAR